jgi:hypothetical protein
MFYKVLLHHQEGWGVGEEVNVVSIVRIVLCVPWEHKYLYNSYCLLGVEALFCCLVQIVLYYKCSRCQYIPVYVLLCVRGGIVVWAICI